MKGALIPVSMGVGVTCSLFTIAGHELRAGEWLTCSRSRSVWGAPLALTAAFGCTLHITEEPTAATSDASAGTTGTSEATPTTTTDPTQVTATDPGTSGTSGAPTGTTAETGTAETAPEPPQWCNGFSPEVTEFTVHNNKDEAIVDGTALAAECGGQRTIMIPVYPHFAGFVPDGDSVAFDVTLDVEGYNVGPDGHFFAVASHVHKSDCGQEISHWFGILPFSEGMKGRGDSFCVDSSPGFAENVAKKNNRAGTGTCRGSPWWMTTGIS